MTLNQNTERLASALRPTSNQATFLDKINITHKSRVSNKILAKDKIVERLSKQKQVTQLNSDLSIINKEITIERIRSP